MQNLCNCLGNREKVKGNREYLIILRFSLSPFTFSLFPFPYLLMDIENIRRICLNLKAVTEEMPFGDTTLVYKVMNKMFLIANLDGLETVIAVKCNPELAIELRERYANIIPGFHLNKKHWNTIYCQRELSNEIIEAQILHSYQMVIGFLKKSEQKLLNENDL